MKALKIPALFTPVKIEWLDSVDQPGWQYVMAGERPNAGLRLPMVTRGVLVATDKDSLTVAATVAPRGPLDLKEGYLDVLTIPLGCIVGVKAIL